MRPRILWLPAFIVLLAACTSSGGVPDPIAGGPLMTVETRGGECFAAQCGDTIVFEQDGSVHSAAKPPNDLGTLTPEQLAALSDAIKATNFGILKGRPFTGECPTAFDGQEFVFEFGAPTGTERIATCEVEVDYGSPLFVVVGAALSSFMPLPVP